VNKGKKNINKCKYLKNKCHFMASKAITVMVIEKKEACLGNESRAPIP
jgi:hypothetical protein